MATANGYPASFWVQPVCQRKISLGFPPWLPWLTQHHTHVPMSNSYPMKPYETVIHHMKPLLPQINMAMNWVVLAMFRQTHAWICLTPKKWNMFPENQVS